MACLSASSSSGTRRGSPRSTRRRASCWEEPFTGPGGITIADAVQSGPYLLVSGFYTRSMMGVGARKQVFVAALAIVTAEGA